MNTQELLERLFIIPRSLTGPGVRETIAVINDELGGVLNVHEIPSGTKVFDWVVPPEWIFHRARMTHESGRVVFDTDKGDTVLHVVGYSEPTDCVLSYPGGAETTERIHFGPHDSPDAIPYLTAYYSDPPTWGVCLSKNQYDSLECGAYHIEIESGFLPNGSLTLADAVIPGETSDEVMLSSYVCHPAGLANNETSGLVVLTKLVQWWMIAPRRHTLRVLLAPETIGPLAYMSATDPPELEWLQSMVKAGFTLTCMGGDTSKFCIQEGRTPNYASRIAAKAITPSPSRRHWGERISDERQWCAPGVDLPWATIMKAHPSHPTYRHRYHTSADDLDYVNGKQLKLSVSNMIEVLRAVETDRKWVATTIGEPQLGKRGLYANVSKVGSSFESLDLLEVLSWCDGRSTMEIAETMDRSFWDVQRHIETLLEHGLIRGV